MAGRSLIGIVEHLSVFADARGDFGVAAYRPFPHPVRLGRE